jgi:2-(1,2-epoxy-1,2-dihydrophenyl)acetyl-CoA isomerase
MSPYETVLFDNEGGVATITLNRPDAFNALNAKMAFELQDAFAEIARNSDIRAVILTGAGRAFCSGQDLRDHQSGVTDPVREVREALMLRYGPLVLAMRALPKPVVGAINGVAAGAGMSLALATDLRIAADNASFTQAFSKIGLVPDAGSNYFLPRLVGVARAMELALTSRRVSAEEAAQIGLVNRVVPADTLSTEAKTLAASLANGPALAIALTKRALLEGARSSLTEVLSLEAELQGQCIVSEDFREGVQAFLEKREAHFAGAPGSGVPANPDSRGGGSGVPAKPGSRGAGNPTAVRS